MFWYILTPLVVTAHQNERVLSALMSSFQAAPQELKGTEIKGRLVQAKDTVSLEQS